MTRCPINWVDSKGDKRTGRGDHRRLGKRAPQGALRHHFPGDRNMNIRNRGSGRVALAAALATASFAQSGADTVKKIEEYRQGAGRRQSRRSWEARGEDLWKQKAGPGRTCRWRPATRAKVRAWCGAYAELPRWFADAQRVMDLETRSVYRRMTLQGLSEAEAKRRPYGNGNDRSDNEALVASSPPSPLGVAMNVAMNHPKEREMYELGRRMFFFSRRAARFRLRDLPFRVGQAHPPAGPAQPDRDPRRAARLHHLARLPRLSQGELRTFQWRLFDCFRQQRFPELVFTSDASIALTMFLARNANGAAYNAPAIKR